jgi:fimbrial chaperone protein
VRRAAALAVLALLAAAPAQAQSRGISVAPVMVSLTPERTISSLRVRNGRDRPTAFEIDAYAWSQENGRDVLTPTRDVIVAPAVFEAAAGTDQVVRVGVVGAASPQERAYRIIIRELPRRSAQGAVLGFTLEMSLPIFVTPSGVRPTIDARVDDASGAPVLRVANLGGAHAQLGGLEVDDGQRVDAPRYMLAGSSVDIPLPAQAAAVRLATLDGTSASERVIDVRRPALAASVR